QQKWILVVGSGGGGGGSTLTISSPLTGSSYNGSSPVTIGINNAAADGATKGAASFTASDFDATSGNISIDYTNGQAATTTNKGFLTNTDWNTFNGKLSTVTADAPISGSGTSGSHLVISQSNTSTNGYLSNTDWNTFNSKESALTFSTGLSRSVNTITADLSTGKSGGLTAIGGTGVTDVLNLQGTTGNGTSTAAAILFKVGNNGATTAAQIFNNGNVGIGANAPAATTRLRVTGTNTGGSDYS